MSPKMSKLLAAAKSDLQKDDSKIKEKGGALAEDAKARFEKFRKDRNKEKGK